MSEEAQQQEQAGPRKHLAKSQAVAVMVVTYEREVNFEIPIPIVFPLYPELAPGPGKRGAS
jgi:hypothetical protein